MNSKNNPKFNNFHPFTMLFFYLCIIVLSIILINPFYTIISFLCALFFAMIYKKSAIKFCLATCLPLVILSTLFNPLFNHKGATILFYLFNNPITNEALVYGLNSGLMLSAVLMWFFSFNFFMTTDKYHYLFSKNLPKTSLILSMSMGLIPKMQRQIKEISESRTMIGKGAKSGLINKIKYGTKNLFALIGWNFQNGLDTADSISARGFGLKNRTSYHRYKIKIFDVVMLVSCILLIGFFVVTNIKSILPNQFFPIFSFFFSDVYNIVLFSIFITVCFLPILVELFMRYKWHILISKI